MDEHQKMLKKIGRMTLLETLEFIEKKWRVHGLDSKPSPYLCDKLMNALRKEYDYQFLGRTDFHTLCPAFVSWIVKEGRKLDSQYQWNGIWACTKTKRRKIFLAKLNELRERKANRILAKRRRKK